MVLDVSALECGGGISVVTHIVLFDNGDELLATFWFLTALFWVSIAYWVMAKFLKRRMTRNILSFILFIFGVILTKNNILIEWTYNFDSIIGTVLTGLWFFSLGDSMKDLKGIRFHQNAEIGCAVLCVVFLFGFQKLGLSCDMRSNSYSSVTGFIICSLAGIAFWLLFCNRIYLFIDNRFQMMKQAVCNIGMWSLHFMALQFLAMKPTSWFICKMLNKPVEGISTFGLVACSRKYQLFGFVCTTVLCYFSAMLIEYIKKVIALNSSEHPSRTQL